MILLRIFGTVSLICLFVNLGGCTSSDITDLDEYVTEVLARPGPRIEPLPEFKPYEAYTYKSGELNARDPFRLFYQKKIVAAALVEEQDSGLTPEMEKEIWHRNKEELEEFELDSLRMVGTMDNEQHQWAMVKDPDGVIHTVEVGNYMGLNVGKILSVSENAIEIREIFKDSSGRWEERQASLVLDEQ